MKYKIIAFLMLSIATFGVQGMKKEDIKPLGNINSQGSSSLAYFLDDQKTYTKMLHSFAETGNLTMVQLCIYSGNDVNAQNINGQTPLHLATKNGYLEVAQFLIDNGANVNAKDIHDWTPLDMAAQFGYLEIAQLLINNGAIINTSDTTPLHYAAKYAHLKIVQLLIVHGADIDAENSLRDTPLDFAKNVDIKSFLTSLKLWQNFEDNKKITAIVDPQFFRSIKETYFSILLNTCDTKNLLAVFNALKDTIQNSFLAGLFAETELTNVTESQFKKKLLIQQILSPLKLEGFFKSGWDEELNDKEATSLQETIKTVQTKRLEYLYALVHARINNRLNWDFKKNLKQNINHFKDVSFVYESDK